MQDQDEKAIEQITSQLTKVRQRNADIKGPDNESAKVARLTEKIATMEEGICIIGYNGKIVGINTAFEELTGYTRDELIGQSPFKIHPEIERERISDGFKKCQENHTTITFKTLFLRKDNRKIPMHIVFETYPK